MRSLQPSAKGLEFDSRVKCGHDFKASAWTLTPTFGSTNHPDLIPR